MKLLQRQFQGVQAVEHVGKVFKALEHLRNAVF